MDFQPTAQPLMAGVRLVAESPGWICGVGRAGGTGEGRREPVHGGLAAASMPRTPSPAPPARPLTHSGGSARHGKKKEDQKQKRKQSFGPSPASRPDRSHPRMAWIDRVDQGRHLPTAVGSVEGGEVSDGGVSAAWMPRPSPQGWVYGVPAIRHLPASPRNIPEPLWLWLWLWPLRVQGAALPNTLRCARRAWPGATRNEKAAFRRLLHYFSLISRRRSSRKPCAVIGSGYRLGFSSLMHEGSTSIRKSGFGCRKNGTE